MQGFVNIMKIKYNYWILFAILLIAIALRFYRLGEVPQGLHHDEISQAYNAFSLLSTGLDRFGQQLPVLFRSFGSFQPPIYTYLSVISIAVFGTTMFAARFVSALFGVLTVFVTYCLVNLLVKEKYKVNFSLLASLVVAISPWAIHFSRRAVEANIGLTLFLTFLYFFIRSLKEIKFIIPSLFFLGVSTHAYYSERLISIIILPIGIFMFRKYFKLNKNWLTLGIIAFGLTLLPHAVSIFTGSFFSRFNQVGSSGSNFIFEFVKHLINYFSPKYLFGDVGLGLSRVAPNLGMFYGFMTIPFFIGFYYLTKVIDKKYLSFLFLLTFVSLIPVSLTGDEFYPLRILEFLWIISIIISVGIFAIGTLIKNNIVKNIISIVLVIYSLASFYVSYFVLYQNEATEPLGRTYIELSNVFEKYRDYHIVIDSPRDPAIGLRVAYFRAYDANLLQKMLWPQTGHKYYKIESDSTENYNFENIETRSLSWGKDRCGFNTILVGDILSFSDAQIKEHNLIKEFEIKGLNNTVALYGYKTNPDKECIRK